MHRKKRSSVDKDETSASTDASKFKKSRMTGRQSSKASVQHDNNETVFIQFLRAAGVSLSQGSASNELAVDQVVFHKRLQQQLRKSPRYPEIVKEFITGLEAHIEDPARFKNCLLPCVPRQADGASSSLSSFQESLIRLLLGVEMLQTLIINTLFEKLPEFMFDSSAVDGLNIPRIIVNQLKWLDRVLDSNDLTAKLMQLVAVAPMEVQRDIITSLPEILEDSQHTDVGRELNSLLQQNTQLSGPILDALSSLNLTCSLLTEVRVGVMATLKAVELEHLPVVVKFILHSISSSDACEVVCDLRKKLELDLCVPPALQASQSHGNHKATAGCSSTAAGSRQDSVSMVLEVIRSTMRFHKTLSEAWLKAIESIDEADDHKVMDLLVLFILHSTNANQSRRGAERVLRQKVRTGLVQEALLHSTFRGFAQVLRGYFPSILALAQTLLRSPDASTVPFGGSMYTHSFTAFDSYCKQEVVGSLVTHVCSGVGGEVGVALELLCGLVEDHPSEMSLYAAFIKGVLDYMDNLSPQQIRRLFHLLSSLAVTQQHQATHIQDDMHIVLRKQLSSPVLKYKRMGIMGGVMVVGSMGAHRPRVEDPAGSTLSKETYRQVTALLELVQSCSRSSPEAEALYYDELANLILTHSLDPQVQTWVGKSVMEDFQKDFVVDVGGDMTGSFLFPPCEMYDLEDDDDQKDFAINLLPLLAVDLQHRDDMSGLPGRAGTERRVSPLCLAPFFRLLRLCESQQNQGDLENIDGLLGCPLVLTDLTVLEKAESLTRPERNFLCALLFYIINWFREVVNAFCRQTDPESKLRVLTRIQNITHLQSLLERALAVTPGFTPPLANFDGETTDVVLASGSAAQPRKGKKESTGKKKKAGNSSTDASLLEEETEETQQQEVREPRPGVSLEAYRPFFRELDLEVLTLLTRPLLDAELSTKERGGVQLGPAELVFLLKDMLYKLEFSLAAGPAKRPVFLKVKPDRTVGFSHLQQKSPKDIASCCVRLLPTLCSHLQNCHTYFQTLLSENQGVVDGRGVDVKEHQLMSTAYQLLLQVLHITFSWSGFSQTQQRGLLKEALGVLASQLHKGGPEPTLDQLTRRGFEYLLNFRCSVPSLSSALTLSQLLSTVAGRGPSPAAYREHTASLARHFLSQEWITASGERENKYNESLTAILSIYLGHCEDVLKAIEEISGEGIPQLLDAAKHASSSSWPTLTRQTFLVFYKGMMAELEKAVRKIPLGKHNDSTEIQSEKLLVWNLAVRDFHFLVNLVKVFDSRPVLNVCLKYGRLFLEAFLRLGMPLLDFSFKKHKEDAQSLLKTFQLSTRQLHHMCGHSKICQATALTNHVPALKKSLEQFVYRVKATLTLNHCQEAFWLGNLKNRDLKGEEILSQRAQESEEEEEDDEQLPQDQSDDEAQEKEAERTTKNKRKVDVNEEDDDDVTDDSDDD
ncbi:Fanconi anemia group D2 protein [Osmerus mordax]|uniref:Fanconi anemia group D2 protein n=1 Tax=Osmerus mordax TaxID=8014 RepID=UPI0035108791